MKQLLPIFIIVAAGSFALGSLFSFNLNVIRRPLLQQLFTKPTPAPVDYTKAVLPEAGVQLPVTWGDLGEKLVKTGVIDSAKFTPITDPGRITISAQNAQAVLNTLWAFGLANKNPILDSGPMVDKQYGGAANFASTGGWTIAVGNAMKYYSKYDWVVLTADQQAIVERVSKNIYRPCCDNSTYFPDCNHGMAMLGLLELMVSQGVSESDMYKYALVVNSYWFPDTYLTIAKYLDSQGKTWVKADPKEILGATYSSSTGYRKIRSQVEPVQQSGGGGCGI